MLTHDRENNDDSERHLSENRDKFESDAMFLYRLMKMGKRFSDQEVVSKYGINGRRLRELFNEKEDVKKQWQLNDKGKRLFVIYFVDQPVSPTKQAAIQMGEKILQQMRDKEIKQGGLFE
jgi:hypothetical protein